MTKKKHKKHNLKQYRQGDPFPDDFWNYNINPITGFYIELLKDKRGVLNPRKENQTVDNTA